MRWARPLACLVVLLVLCSCGEDGPGQPLLNRCTQAFECIKPSKCDQQLGYCTRDKFDRPYDLVVLVNPDDETLTRTTASYSALQQAQNIGAIHVERAVTVNGKVLEVAGNQDSTFSAEVAFVPESNGALTGGVSALTQPLSGEASLAFTAALEPSISYDVHVFPRGADSERLPPQIFSLPAPIAPQFVSFPYPLMVPHSATLLDENKLAPPAGTQLRLRNRATQRFVSSIGQPDRTVGSATYGRVRLSAPTEVWSSPADYELVMDVPFGDANATVSIVFDASPFALGTALTMPVIPVPMAYDYSAEVGDANTAHSVSANVTFVSSFPIPKETSAVNDRDWCRLKLPGSKQGTFTCNTTVQTQILASGGPAVSLLPGDYQIYFAPSGASPEAPRTATTNKQENIETRADGRFGPKAHQLNPSVVYSGNVSSAAGQPMPGVTVTANALGVTKDLPEVARYNRTVSQVSDRRGLFQLAVDTGYYDLIATPPDNSNYAWVVNFNRAVAGTSPADGGALEQFSVEPETPVILRGTVVSEALVDGGGAGPLQASVEAYAIVPDLASGGTRAVRVARTTSDSHGDFALALPPYVGEPPLLTTDDGGAATATELDAGSDLDAGR